MTLVPLSRRETARLPAHTWDVRGWEVRTEVGDEDVGTVEDMLLDERGNPRLLAVETFKKRILLPLDRAWADPDRKVVWVEDLERKQLNEVPRYDVEGDTLSEEYEARLAEHYDRIAGDGARPGARAGDDARGERAELARLDELEDYRVSKTSADPRGWTVVTGDGAKVGEAVDLLVDRASMKARYLVVALDEKELGLEPLDRRVLLPSGHVHLDGSKKRVHVDGLFANDLGRYPVYGGLPLGATAEREVEEAFHRRRDTGEQERGLAARRFFRAGRSDEAPVEPAAAEREPAGRRATVGATGGGTTVREGEEAHVRTDAGEVRIRVSGDDIIIEKNPNRGA